MICPRCGTPNQECARFCQNCASPLSAKFLPVSQACEMPRAKILKEKFSSPLFILCAAVLSLRLLLLILSLGAVYLFDSRVQRDASALFIPEAVMLVPIAIGVWMIFVQARNREKRMRDSGFSVLSACGIIVLVGASIAVLIMLCVAAVSFFGIITGQGEYLVSYLSPAFRTAIPEGYIEEIAYTFVFTGTALAIFATVFLAKFLRSLGMVRRTVKNAGDAERVSALLPVGFFIFAAASALSAAAFLRAGAPYSAVTEVLSAIQYVLCAAFAISLRREPKEAESNVLSDDKPVIDPYTRIERR